MQCGAGSYKLLPAVIESYRGEAGATAKEKTDAIGLMDQLLRERLLQVSTAWHPTHALCWVAAFSDLLSKNTRKHCTKSLN